MTDNVTADLSELTVELLDQEDYDEISACFKEIKFNTYIKWKEDLVVVGSIYSIPKFKEMSCWNKILPYIEAITDDVTRINFGLDARVTSRFIMMCFYLLPHLKEASYNYPAEAGTKPNCTKFERECDQLHMGIKYNTFTETNTLVDARDISRTKKYTVLVAYRAVMDLSELVLTRRDFDEILACFKSITFCERRKRVHFSIYQQPKFQEMNCWSKIQPYVDSLDNYVTVIKCATAKLKPADKSLVALMWFSVLPRLEIVIYENTMTLIRSDWCPNWLDGVEYAEFRRVQYFIDTQGKVAARTNTLYISYKADRIPPVNSSAISSNTSEVSLNKRLQACGKSVSHDIRQEELGKKDVQKTVHGKCNVCYDNSANTVFYPCGHLFACTKCADVIGKGDYNDCPVCRVQIVDIVRVYDATVDV